MPPAHYRLVIGNKKTSSWSLRPWLVLKRLAIEFDEIRINLRDPDAKQKILEHSPAGKVPVLWAGDLMIWDSLAIIEYLADKHPDLNIWPSEPTARAIARSVASEMHSGFEALRSECPMAVTSDRRRDDLPEDVGKDIERIITIWIETRKRFGSSGRFLFSKFSAADAMYAPVASRLRTYVPDLASFGDDGTAKAYVDTVLAMPEMKTWTEDAYTEIAES